MSKYAPGPWEVWTDKANDGTPYIRVYQRTPDDEHITICTMGISDGEAWGGYVGEEEDARLIAAAPDLLRGLEAMIGLCHGCRGRGRCFGSVPVGSVGESVYQPCPECSDARAAIAKAKGEKP